MEKNKEKIIDFIAKYPKFTIFLGGFISGYLVRALF
jgi:hypothetical protein